VANLDPQTPAGSTKTLSARYGGDGSTRREPARAAQRRLDKDAATLRAERRKQPRDHL
jgi:hypothetical protein